MTALEKLKQAAAVVGMVIDAGEREVRWHEFHDLEEACRDFVRAQRNRKASTR
jgi:hypothetical protein